jgi:hypothetical protein
VRTPVPPVTKAVALNALKFDDATKKIFLSALRQGFPIEQACGIADISRQTLWRHRRSNSKLNDEIEAARAMFALGTIQKMDIIGVDNLDHWRWRLEKALPESFGKQTQYSQIGTQNNVFIAPELPSLDEIVAKITAAREAALAKQIESEKKYEDAVLVPALPSPEEYVEGRVERLADGPLPD